MQQGSRFTMNPLSSELPPAVSDEADESAANDVINPLTNSIKTNKIVINGHSVQSFDGIEYGGENENYESSKYSEKIIGVSIDEANAKVENILPNIISAAHAPNQNSKGFIVFLLLNTMIGSGILNQPEVFFMSGLCGALMSFAVCTAFIWLGLVCLIECGNFVQRLDYSELASFAFGRTGELIVDILIVLNNFGALLSYLTIVGGTTSELLVSWQCHSDGCNVYTTTSLSVILLVFPVCTLRYYGHLTYISIFSIASIASVLLLVLIGGPIVGEGGAAVAFKASGTKLIMSQNLLYIILIFLGGLRKFGSIVFALSCAPASFHAYKSMGKKTDKDWREVCAIAVVAGAIMCIAMGIG
jgi:amino acid permease